MAVYRNSIEQNRTETSSLWLMLHWEWLGTWPTSAPLLLCVAVCTVQYILNTVYCNDSVHKLHHCWWHQATIITYKHELITFMLTIVNKTDLNAYVRWCQLNCPRMLYAIVVTNSPPRPSSAQSLVANSSGLLSFSDISHSNWSAREMLPTWIFN